jgi:ribosomal protein S18 acetylase RimI-like enzyme
MKRAAYVLARAFQNEPMMTHVFPDDEERARSMYSLSLGVVKYTSRYGATYIDPGENGAACWLAPGNTKATVLRALRTGLLGAIVGFRPASRHRFFGIMNHCDEMHPRLVPGPHWYLWLVGVDPEHQGNGLGGALLRPVLARADADGVPCYLETLNEPNVGFYTHLGFEVVNEGTVPGQGVYMWTMLRQPKR